MNQKPVYLLAGSRGRRRRGPDPLIQAVFRETGKASPTVAYVGTASDDNAWFFRMIERELKNAGAGSINHAIITPRKADLRKARDILAAADIIFISGGDMERGMEVLREKGMVDFLFQLYQQGKPFFGLSAGSIMLAKEWVRWRDPEDDSTAELFPCLGFAPVICDTHDEENDWQELKAALKLEKDNTIGYGIVSGAAIKVFPDGRIEALGNITHRYIRHRERVDRMADILPINNK